MLNAALPALDQHPRHPLLAGLTPIERLTRLEHVLGPGCPPLHVKRDDVMGVGGGGNKLRKLEFLLGDALAQGCTHFLTTGARQSNHARLSAAAAARAGLTCELMLTDTVARDDEAYRHNGNVLLDGILAAKVHRLPGGADALGAARRRAADLSAAGKRPYVVGSGGSSPVGCLGYAACAAEIVAQERAMGRRFARIVVPNGSSGTQAGLVAGMTALGEEPRRVMSFTVLAPADEARRATRDLARDTLALLDPAAILRDDDVVVSGEQLGAGYGVPTDAMVEALHLIARTEGLLIDPVYGGKAFAGVIAAIRRGEWAGDEPILFVMTGGLPGLFAYEPVLREDR